MVADFVEVAFYLFDCSVFVACFIVGSYMTQMVSHFFHIWIGDLGSPGLGMRGA